MIMARTILRDSPPVHRFRCKMGIAKASDHIAIPSFLILVFLAHEGNPTEATHQGSIEIAIREIALQSHRLFALTIE